MAGSAGEPKARVAIVGAGIAGLAAARWLTAAGAAATVVDKGRAPGGRVATRRGAGGLVVDHGAQYFTVRDPELAVEVTRWAGAGVVARWDGRIASLAPGGEPAPVTPGEPLWIGREGNSALPRHLAAGLDVRTGRRVAAVRERGGGWCLEIGGGEVEGPFDALLVTAPAPQAAALFPPDDPLGAVASAVPMLPTWALLLRAGEEDGLPFDGAFVSGSPVAWWKRGRSPGSWVAHASHEWSAAHLEETAEEVAATLAAALAALAGGSRLEIREATAHRWRHAAPADGPLPPPAGLVDPRRRAALAGDWCRGGRVEGAWLAGRAAARELALALGLGAGR